MKIDFSDQVVMVTGASRGIGREIARRFADSGARVVVHYHKNSNAAEQTLAGLCGHSHLMVSADLADAAAVGNMAEKTFKEMGKIDVLVNNAGVYEFHPVATTTFEEWQRSWEKTLFTNLLGPAHLVFSCGPPHDEKRRRKNHQHHFTGCLSRGTGRSGLWRQQGRTQRLQSIHGPGPGPA